MFTFRAQSGGRRADSGALLIFGLVASFFPGWVAAIMLGIYVAAALIKQRGGVRC